jgi:hypothetical protein
VSRAPEGGAGPPLPRLFDDHDYIEGDGAGTARRHKRPCRVPGCTEPALYGAGYIYCAAHVCDYDTCKCLVVERGRCKRHAYCRAEGCPNMRRDRQAAKYCQDHATSIDYELRKTVPFTTTGVCLACDRTVTQRRAIGVYRSLLLCPAHRHLRDLFNSWRHRYNLDDDQIRGLVCKPRCWVDGGDLTWRFENWAKSRAARGNVHVDHDHRCCPGDYSCGRCVRGLTHEACNRRLGQVEAMLEELGIERMHQLLDQLTEPDQRNKPLIDAH